MGGQSALARAIGVKQGNVWYWLNGSEKQEAPAQYVIPIERAVDGQVTRHDLRPDLYPAEEVA